MRIELKSEEKKDVYGILFIRIDSNQRRNLQKFENTAKDLLKEKKVIFACQIMGWFDYSFVVSGTSLRNMLNEVENIREKIGESREIVVVGGKLLESINLDTCSEKTQIVGIVLVKFDPELRENPIQIFHKRLKPKLERLNVGTIAYATFGFHEFLLWTMGDSMEDIFNFSNDLNTSIESIEETTTICGKPLQC